MSELINERVSFGHGFVQSRDRVRVIARFDDMAAQGSAASMLMMWAGEARGWRHFELSWTAIRIACTDAAMFALAGDGRVLVADATGVREERIEGPESRGELRDLRLIAGRPVAVGAGGQVYRREPGGDWARLDNGRLADAAPNLNAVHGIDQLLAAGDGGEIWHLEGQTWERVATPTDAALHALRELEPGLVVTVGQGGVLLRGGAGGVAAAAEQAPEDLWDVERFGGRVLAAGRNGLYGFDDDGRVTPVRVFDGPSWTFCHLHAGDGTLWSFGAEHLIWTADGQSWNLVRSPFQSVDPTEFGTTGGGSCGCGSGHHDHHC
jgi:hypothetical protein